MASSKKEKKKPAITYATGLISQSIYFFSVPPSFIWGESIKSVILKPHEQWKRIPSHFHGLSHLCLGVALVNVSPRVWFTCWIVTSMKVAPCPLHPTVSNFQQSACLRSHSIHIWWESHSIPVLFLAIWTNHFKCVLVCVLV